MDFCPRCVDYHYIIYNISPTKQRRKLSDNLTLLSRLLYCNYILLVGMLRHSTLLQI